MNTDGHATLVQEVLEDYGGVVRRALVEDLDGLAARESVYRLAADYPMRGGRTLRASLCIAAARAFGAPVDHAIQTALSLELLHNAFLVHDDIEDGSVERRGKPALHVLHGVPTAINVGDALAVLGLGPLLKNRHILGPALAWSILHEAQRMTQDSVEGQALELQWRKLDRPLTDHDYLRMTLKKTCCYTTIYPSRVGALIGTRDATNLDRFTRFGFFLGAAFQIQDDLLNLVGDHTRYGKEMNGDLMEGKRTLMVIHLRRALSGAEASRLDAFLALDRSDRIETDVSWVRHQMLVHGSLDHARNVAHALAGAAVHEFRIAFGALPESRDKRFIGALPHWVLARS